MQDLLTTALERPKLSAAASVHLFLPMTSARVQGLTVTNLVKESYQSLLSAPAMHKHRVFILLLFVH